jgi:hypothetical protein
LDVNETRLTLAEVDRYWITGVARYVRSRRLYLQQNQNDPDFELNNSSNMTVNDGNGFTLSLLGGKRHFGVSIHRPEARFGPASAWPRRRIARIQRALSQQPLGSTSDVIRVQVDQILQRHFDIDGFNFEWGFPDMYFETEDLLVNEELLVGRL